MSKGHRARNATDLAVMDSGRCSRGVAASKVAATLAGSYQNTIGRHMNTATNNLDVATDAFKQAQANVINAATDLHAHMDGLSKRAKDSIGRAKDVAAQMSDAMNKITKVLGPDFEKRLVQLETLTACLERLADLQANGKLAPIMDALNGDKRKL